MDIYSHSSLQIAGEPLDQGVVQYGPFVMTTKEEIQETFKDCKFTRNMTGESCSMS